MIRIMTPPTGGTEDAAAAEAGLAAYVRGYLDSQRRPDASGRVALCAEQIRALLLEAALACLLGEQSETFVVELARQLSHESEMADDERLYAVLKRLLRPARSDHDEATDLAHGTIIAAIESLLA